MEKGYVIRYLDGLFFPWMERKVTSTPIMEGNENLSNAHIFKEADEAVKMAKTIDHLLGVDMELLEKDGKELSFLGNTRDIIRWNDLDERLEELKEDKKKDIGICPHCGWTDHDNRYMRCIPCSSNGDRIAMDGTTQAEVNRMEYEHRKEEEYMASLLVYKVILLSEQKDVDVVLTVARSKEEAVRKAEKKRKDVSFKVLEAEPVSEVDGYNLQLLKSVK